MDDKLRQRTVQFLRERPHAKHIAHLRMADALVADLLAELDRLTDAVQCLTPLTEDSDVPR